MLVNEIRTSPEVVVRIYDDYIEHPAQVEKRLEAFSRIITNSYKRRAAGKSCIPTEPKYKPHSK